MIILLIIIFALLGMLSNDALAQTESLHDRRLSEVVKQTSSVSNGNAQIKVGRLPSDLAIGKAGTLYVADYGSNTISVISTESNSKIKDIPVGVGPAAIAINEDTNTIYVANNGSNTVSVIDGWNNAVIQEIPVGVGPTDIAISERFKKLAIAGSFTISIISTEDNTKTQDIPVGSYTNNIIAFEDNYLSIGNKLYVAGYGWGWNFMYEIPINELNTDLRASEKKDIPVGVDDPAAIAINDHTSTIYVANTASNIYTNGCNIPTTNVSNISTNGCNPAAPNTISVISVRNDKGYTCWSRSCGYRC
jgi:YVTN family beta-propeller protein